MPNFSSHWRLYRRSHECLFHQRLGVVGIVSKQAWLRSDRRLLTATNLIYVKMNMSGTVTPCRHVKKSHALCLLLATERARVGECLMLRWRRRNLSRRPTPHMMDTFDVLLVDLQDVGCRIYTFVTTLRYVLEAAAGKTFCALALRRETARTPAGARCMRLMRCAVRASGPLAISKCFNSDCRIATAPLDDLVGFSLSYREYIGERTTQGRFEPLDQVYSRGTS